MTLDEALQELGIERSASPDEARRAYLRGIKTRKPETDPEGFRRLREAYERVAGLLKEQPAPEPVPREEAPDDEESEGGEDEDDEEDWEGEEDWEEEAAPPELADLAARLSRMPPATHKEERLAVLRQAVQDHPASSGVRWWLVQELSQPGDEEELLAVLRDGEAAGFPDFLKTRADRFPDSMDAEDLARLGSSGDLDLLSLAAKVYLRRSQPREAVAVLDRVIDQLEAQEDTAVSPLPFELPRMLLALEAAGLSQDAKALHDRLWRWLSCAGDANLLKRWGTVYWWQAAHELGQLDPAFPPALRKAAALAVLTSNQASAREQAKRFAQESPETAEQVSAMLYDLPLLYNLYYRILQGIEPGAMPFGGGGTGGGGSGSEALSVIFRLIPALIIAVLSARGCDDSPPLEERARLYQTQQMQSQVQIAWLKLLGSCDDLPKPACEAALRVVQLTDAGDCAAARGALAEVENAASSVDDETLSRVVDFSGAVISALDAGCRPYPP